MKRNLFDNSISIPYASDEVVERKHYLSAVVGMKVSDAPVDGTKVKVSISHSDTKDGTFEVVLDERAFMDDTKVVREPDQEEGGYTLKEVFSDVNVFKDSLAIVNIDLLGCKEFIKIKVDAGANTAICALTLGDADINPR